MSTTPLPKVTLIGAPAGWGKTTLVTEWLANGLNGHRFAWLALDDDDNDPARFWMYVFEALRAVEPGVGASLTPATLQGQGVLRSALPNLINELDGLSDVVVLVLDDYHRIRSGEIHDGMEYLIAHLPATLRIVLVTRSDPRLPLAMLRVEGNIGEVRADALRFTEAEASELFAEALDLDLEVDQVTRLQARTEGWAAGLVLAALSLRGHTESEKFVATFAGDDRNVVDFLGSEVLGGLSDDVRTFLLQTSVLDSLCADLCDEVRGAHDSASLLSEIERSNLFLVPLDTTRGWYRYHHLFAGLLRFELAQGNATEVPTLHRRAAAWLSKNGQISQAIRHAILAGDFTDAGDMIASNWPAFLQQGQLASVSGWLNRLPADAVAADARLCLTQAWIAVNEGRIDDVRTWSDAAERAAAQVSDTDEASSLEAAAGMLACIYEYLGGDLNRAVEAANTARSLRSDENSPWRSVGCPVLGIAQFWSADLTGEESTLEQAIRRAGPAGNHIAIIHAQACLAVRHAERGEWGQANRLAQTAIDHGEEHGLEEHWTIAMAHTALGKVLSQRGQFDDAEIAARRGAALSGQGVAKVEKAYSLLVHATAQNALGQHAAARALVHDAREEIASCPNPGVLTEMLAASERGLRVKVLVGGSGRNELTERELAVLQMFESSLSLREIAAALFVSLNTVKTHAKGIYRKLGTSSREEAVAKARELGLTS